MNNLSNFYLLASPSTNNYNYTLLINPSSCCSKTRNLCVCPSIIYSRSCPFSKLTSPCPNRNKYMNTAVECMPASRPMNISEISMYSCTLIFVRVFTSRLRRLRYMWDLARLVRVLRKVKRWVMIYRRRVRLGSFYN